jgi:hypothetical protein
VNPSRADEDDDAALIDRLYGGDSTDEDLEPFRGVRSLIARVRDEAPALEPAQAISARLLQAAEEHAPKRQVATVKVGFFGRIFDWLSPVTAHPGVLAAATLVVVAGAVVVWKQRGGKVEEPSYQAERSEVDRGADDSSALEEEREETERELEQPAEKKAELAVVETTASNPPEPQGEPAKPEKLERRPTKKEGGKSPGGPKDEPEGRSGGEGVVVGGQDDGDGAGSQAEAPPPPPPPPPDQHPQTTAKEPVADEPSADKKPESTPSSETDAQRLTRDARTAARKGKCGEVEDLASRVNEIDPGYYKGVFVKDPDIKACRSRR